MGFRRRRVNELELLLDCCCSRTCPEGEEEKCYEGGGYWAYVSPEQKEVLKKPVYLVGVGIHCGAEGGKMVFVWEMCI